MLSNFQKMVSNWKGSTVKNALVHCSIGIAATMILVMVFVVAVIYIILMKLHYVITKYINGLD